MLLFLINKGFKFGNTGFSVFEEVSGQYTDKSTWSYQTDEYLSFK